MPPPLGLGFGLRHSSGNAYVPPGVVTSISPAVGSTAGGTPVTITGTGLAATTSGTIGGVAVTSYVAVNATTVTCVTGAHAAGATDVVVTNAGGASPPLTNGFRYLANMLGDWDANLGITKDGGNIVSVWVDQLGVTGSLTPPVAGPLWVASANNSLPAVRFNGTTQFIRSPSFALAQPFTWWMVAKLIADTAGPARIIVADTTVNQYGSIYQGNPGQINAYSGGAGPASTEMTIGTYFVVSAVENGASSILTVVTDITSGDVGAGGLATGFQLGAYSAGSFLANFEIQRLLLIGNANSTADRAAIRASLKAQYAL